MYTLETYWRRRFAGTGRKPSQSSGGWSFPKESSPAFVEPELVRRDELGRDDARVILVSAPGAVGKSTYAREIASSLGLALLDLAQAGPVGANFLVGGAFQYLGATGPGDIAAGSTGILIDALDEAQLKVTPTAFDAFLKDVVGLAPQAGGPPIVLLGRTAAVEEAWLAHVGLLHSSLRARAEAGQRVELTVVGEDDASSSIDLRLVAVSSEGVPADRSALVGATSGKVLSLSQGIGDVIVDAESISVELSATGPLIIDAPTIIRAGSLSVSGSELVIRGQRALGKAERLDSHDDAVMLAAADFRANGDLSSKLPAVSEGVALALSFPHVKTFPWTKFAFDLPSEPVGDIAALYRRLRKLVVAFRSHSKGDLRRYAPKIEHRRMTKGDLGMALIEQLLDDRILEEVGNFYRLDSDLLGQKLGIDYVSVRLAKTSPLSDSYLRRVLARIARDG